MKESPYRVAIIIMGGLLLVLLLLLVSCGRADRQWADADESYSDTITPFEEGTSSDEAFTTEDESEVESEVTVTDKNLDRELADDDHFEQECDPTDEENGIPDEILVDDSERPDGEPTLFNACGINRDGIKASGAWNDPIIAPYLPMVDHNSTADGVSTVHNYSCGGVTPVNALASEKVYATEITEAGTLSIDLAAGSKMRIFLLDSASQCIAQNDKAIERNVAPGYYLVVVDGEQSGTYTLAIELFIPNRWTDIELAPGLHWMRMRTPELLDTVSPDTYAALIEPHLAAGHTRHTYGMQTINVLTIDPVIYAPMQGSPTLRVAPVVLNPGLLELVSEKGAELGAIAAVNASFFNIDQCPPKSNAEPCHAVHLFKADGTVYSYNKSSLRTVGWNDGETPEFTVIGPNEDWPEKGHAIGIISPLINEEDIPLFGDEDNAPNEFKIDNPLTPQTEKTRHPRTIMALTDDGTIILMTFDGRTDRGDGMYLYQLAYYLRYEWLAVDAVNLDGGGSTTMWVADCSVNGIVNYPADLRKELSNIFNPDCTAVHHHDEWEREVNDGIFIFAQ